MIKRTISAIHRQASFKKYINSVFKKSSKPLWLTALSFYLLIDACSSLAHMTSGVLHIGFIRCKQCIQFIKNRCNFCNSMMYYTCITIIKARIGTELGSLERKQKLMKELGRQAYAESVHFNFNPKMAGLFASDLDADRLIWGQSHIQATKLIRTTPCRFLMKCRKFQEH